MTPLDRAHFESLYLNANSIAEIAFLRALDAAASAPVQAPTPEQRADFAALAAQLANPDPANFNWAALEGVYGFDGALDIPPLAASEDARPSRQARISDCFARVDMPALEAVLATLPTDRPSLASTLAPAAFTRWLELYESHHAGLQAAVLEIRKLEPMFPGQG